VNSVNISLTVKYKETISFECLFATICSEKPLMPVQFHFSALISHLRYGQKCIYSGSAHVGNGVIEQENVQYRYVYVLHDYRSTM
jgi:hypothetical protein